MLPKEENIKFKVSANKFLGWKGISSNVYTDTIDNDKTYVISKDGNPGPVVTKLYHHLQGIQKGDIEDIHGWVTILD